MIAPKIFRNCRSFFMLLVLTMAATSSYADMVVIVSAKNPVTSLTSEQISRIFLGKIDTFPNGGDAYPIDQAEGSAVRSEFYSQVVGKSASQLAAYWAKIIFTGDGRPPKLLEGNEAVRNAVAKNPNAIGYIDKSAVDSSVRVILDPNAE